MKIALVNPISPKSWIHFRRGIFKKFLSKYFSTKTLPYLAGLTPPDVEIMIFQELPHIKEIIEAQVNMVGISVLTHAARWAYDIADKLRENGVTVVLGGIHPSAIPEEAINHADAVVLGEAEGVWEQLIRDYQKGVMKKFYRRDCFHDLRNLPIPRWDLLKGYGFPNVVTPIVATRGCPFGCEFCSVPIIYGKKYRFRPIEDVLQEIEIVGSKYYHFIDNNLVGNLKYAKELSRRIRLLKKKWGCYISTTAVKDKELLQLFEKGGCVIVDIGFESLSDSCLREIKKHHNLRENYKDVIKKLHDHGIAVIGNFMFGFDHDDKGIFERTLEFCIKNQIDYPCFFIIIPYPGTPLYHRLKREKRLYCEKWWLDDIEWKNIDCSPLRILYQPKMMSPEELLNGYLSIFKRAYEFASILERTRAVNKIELRLICITLNMISKSFYNNILFYEKPFHLSTRNFE